MGTGQSWHASCEKRHCIAHTSRYGTWKVPRCSNSFWRLGLPRAAVRYTCGICTTRMVQGLRCGTGLRRCTGAGIMASSSSSSSSVSKMHLLCKPAGQALTGWLTSSSDNASRAILQNGDISYLHGSCIRVRTWDQRSEPLVRTPWAMLLSSFCTGHWCQLESHP